VLDLVRLPLNIRGMSQSNLKTVLVTGATSGLGLECSRALLQHGGYRVILGARNIDKAQRVQATLPKPHLSSVLQVDLSSLEQVKRAAAALVEGPLLDAVVCNAGVHETGAPTFTADGFETTFAVNHLAHQLLVLRLFPRLAETARVVLVSSGTHDPQTLEGRPNPPGVVDVLALSKGRAGEVVLPAVRRYSTSKLCNVLFARELHRRLRVANSRVSVNAFDPGAVPGTELTRNWSPALKLLVHSSWILRVFGVAVSTVPSAARSMARLVVDESLEGKSGHYFQLDRERQPSIAAQDADLARRLYDDSLKLMNEQSPL
jgi:NAD(P)-dependent dehydrogenase (short-subunit alcohol dehydrogenase family)